MAKITKKSRDAIQKMIDQKMIFWGEVQSVSPVSNKGRYMSVAPTRKTEISNYPCVIWTDEADAVFSGDTMRNLVGFTIPFIVVGINEEGGDISIICSRKRAQLAIRESLATQLREKKEMTGTILFFVDYGAFVDVGGLVGLLKKTDFSTDYSNISEFKREGEKVRVVCKSFDETTGQISWEAVSKVHREVPFKNEYSAGMVCLGSVIAVGSFKAGYGVFVRLRQGNQSVDALCSLGPDMDVDSNSRVAVKISKVEPSKDITQPPRIRGRIIRVL